MRASSAKAKGRRACQEIKSLILSLYQILQEDDVRVTPSGVPGSDLQLSPLAKTLLPFNFEVKNVEKINIWNAIRQVEKRAKEDEIPLVVIKRNRTKAYACIDFISFLRLIKYKEKNDLTP